MSDYCYDTAGTQVDCETQEQSQPLEVNHSLRLFYGSRNGWRPIELPEFVAGELGGVHCSPKLMPLRF